MFLQSDHIDPNFCFILQQTGFYSGRFQDEDIYDFGKMVFSENEGWLYGFDDIDLKGKLKSGDFADIYLAKICKKDMAVAKILKGS